MRDPIIPSLLALGLLPQAVWGATTCTFTTECLEGEACTDTAFTAAIAPGEGETLTLETEAETLSGFITTSGDTLHYVFEGTSAAHLLSDYADGSARYTVHMDGPFTITYHGTCEGAP